MSRRAWWMAGGLVFAYLGFTAWAWAGAAAGRTDDSYRYYPERWLDFSGILEPLNGGVLASAVYAVLHDPVLIAGAQVLVFALASSLLAIAVVHRLRGHWTGWVLAVGVLAISLLPVFWSSHLVLASESLMFTAATLWLASAVWLSSARRGEIRPLVANTSAIALLAVVRPQAMLALLPAQLVLLVWWGRYERSGRAAFAAIASIIPFAGFAALRVWQIADHDRWPLRYVLHNLVAKDSSFRDYALSRMPPCELVTAGLAGPTPWPSTLALETTMPSACPDSFMWLTSNASDASAWVPEIPSQSITAFLADLLGLRLVSWTGDAALPRSFDSLLMPNASPWILLGGAFAAGILLAILAGVRPRITFLGVVGVMFALVPIIGFIFVVWAVDGLDFGRHVFPFLPLAASAALVLPATICARPERVRRAALRDATSRWASPVTSLEQAVS